MPYTQRLPCVKGAVAKRLRDCAVQPPDENNGLAKRYAKTTLRQNLPDLTALRQNRSSSDSVRSDDGHAGKSAVTTPQSASLTAPLTQGSPWRVPHRHRVPLPKQLYKFQFVGKITKNEKYFAKTVSERDVGKRFREAGCTVIKT